MELNSLIHDLGELLGQVISAQESPELFQIEERIRMAAKARREDDDGAAQQLTAEVQALATDEARAVAAAFALYFDLVNLAEEANRVRILRQRADDEKIDEDTLAESLANLKARGVTPQQLEQLLAELKVELVLTAHPTEARAGRFNLNCNGSPATSVRFIPLNFPTAKKPPCAKPFKVKLRRYG
ncbi:MAG: hypothetical protein JNL09_00665 [Anaerolineales bacterium]|nr:hypothetical protein [Anaerolineales bacterium]